MAPEPVPTPHNAARLGDIAPVVLMPGDPLRARYIADRFLESARCVNEVRNMLAYTGAFRGRPVTVMGSGMGMPSIGIYAHELYRLYGVETIVRVGSAGGYADDLELRDLVIAQGACTNSRFAHQFKLPGTFAPIASFDLLEAAVRSARGRGARFRVGNVLSSDTFYEEGADAALAWKRMGVLAVEMETAALYMIAARAGKRALSLLTVSDKPLTGEGLPAKAREQTFDEMVEVALGALRDPS